MKCTEIKNQESKTYNKVGEPMDNFNLSIPTKIYFGSDILEKALEESKNVITGNVMIVTGKQAMQKLGYINILEKTLSKNSNVEEVVVFEGISPNPKVSEINEAIKLGIKKDINIVVGIGGGSAIDAAKAIAVGVGEKESIEEYLLNGKAPSNKTLKIIAIPSTAGTGAELSKGAILSYPEKNIKNGIRGENIYPTIAIVDPKITYKLSQKITSETGFDVFTHAIETYISTMSNPFSEMLSIEVLKIVGYYLPRLVANLEDTEARDKMSYASMLMGINLGNTSTCLPHRLQYPIGAKTDTSHSAGLACIYKSWVNNTYEYSKDKFNKLGEILSGNVCTSKEMVLESLNDFMCNVKVDIKIQDLGINENDISELVGNVSGSIKNDPGSCDDNIIEKIYKTAFES